MSTLSLATALLSSLALPPADEPAAPAAALTSLDGAPVTHSELWDAPRPVQRGAKPTGATGPAAFTGAGGLLARTLEVNEHPEGDLPRSLAFLPDGSAVAIANRDTDTLTFLDVNTLTITDTVDVGDFPTDVAVTPDGSLAVAPCVFENALSVVDVATRTLLANVPLTGDQPFAVKVTPDSARAVVAVINDGVASSFSVVDLNTLSETSSFPSSSQGGIGFFFTPENGISGNLYTQFALTPDGATIVLPDRGNGRVRLYDVASGAETADIAVAAAPISVDVSADGTTAVLGHESGINVISEVDLASQTVTGSFPTAALQGQVVRITPDKAHALAAISNNVIFVDLATGATTSTVSTGIVGDIEFSFDGQYAFVSNANSRVIDVASQSLVATLPLNPCVDAVMSPVEHRAVALNNRFAEDVHVYTTDGAASSVVGRALSGEPFEADAPRTLAVTPDGLTALVANNTSYSAAIVDLALGTVRGYADTGERSLGVAVTPDGATGVICNGDQDTVSIIDLVAGGTVATLPISGRPSEVAISPDGSEAYVSSIAGTDRVHFIDLAGAASSVTGSVVAGQMGSIIYTYNVISGLAASPAGDVVAACISFDDELLLIDANTHAVLVRVPVGDFPIRVAFNADGSKAYVVNAFGDSVSVVTINGAASSVSATIPGVEFPLVNVADDTGTLHFVGNFDGNDPRLAVIHVATDTMIANVALPGVARAAAYSASDAALFLATTGGELVKVAVAGAASAVVDSVPLLGAPSDLGFSDVLGRVVCAEPGILDAVDLVDVRAGAWTDLGNALAGAHGEPSLVGLGDLTAGSTFGLAMTGALENSVTALVIGLSQLGLPFKGGVMVPEVDALVAGIPTGPAGSLLLTGTWAPGIPPGFQWWAQEWISDPAGPLGFSATNGVRGATP